MQLTPQDICQMCADSLLYKPYVRNVNVRCNISHVSFPELILTVTSTLFPSQEEANSKGGGSAEVS